MSDSPTVVPLPVLPEYPQPASAPVQATETMSGGVLRASSYTIYVDLPDNSEEMLLVHGYTGAYDKVSRRVATYVRSLELGPPPKPLFGSWSPEPLSGDEAVSPSDETVEMLKRRGYLTNKTREQEDSFFSKMAGKLHHNASQRMPGYVFMPTYQCNLRCPYCFQDHMRTNPAYQHLLRTMSPGVIDRIFAAMPQIEAGHGIEPGSQLPRLITFFGGEPLLEASRPTIEYIIKKATAMGKARFIAVTNGTELQAYEDLLGPDLISVLQITLDGPPSEHDKRRIYPDGSGSFDRIARNIDMALARGISISLRMNVDRKNIANLPSLADEFHKRGWAGAKGFSPYAAVVHASNEKTAVSTTMSSWELTRALRELCEREPQTKIIGGPDDGMEDRARRLFESSDSPIPSFKASFCGAHNRMYIFDAFADIYACWERTGDQKIRIGHVDEAGVPNMNQAITERWRHRTVVSNPVCRSCRFAFYCGGGCAVYAENRSGTMYSNFCDGFGKRFRAAAARAYLAHVAGDKPANRDAEAVCDL
jgi:uncharacterized protein